MTWKNLHNRFLEKLPLGKWVCELYVYPVVNLWDRLLPSKCWYWFLDRYTVHMHAHTAKTCTPLYTTLYVSADIIELISHLRCGGPAFAGPSPFWWPTCGTPHGPAPSLPHPAGLSPRARWKTPHYQSGSDLTGKKDSFIWAHPFLF